MTRVEPVLLWPGCGLIRRGTERSGDEGDEQGVLDEEKDRGDAGKALFIWSDDDVEHCVCINKYSVFDLCLRME